MMDKSKILVVDDDLAMHAQAEGVLGAHYRLTHCVDGREALERALCEVPHLILMDTYMPHVDGYEACRLIRGHEALRQVPVIFISDEAEIEDRLAAYDAGGEDFIARPYDPPELLRKVEIALCAARERARLADAAQSAFATAMTAMSTVGEVGVVLQFLRESFACDSYESLGRAVLSAVGSYGLNALVQVRGRVGILSLNREGLAAQNEADILSALAGCGRIVALRQRAAFSYERITVLIQDMPLDDPDRAGRMRDNLALLAEGADARIRAMDAEVLARDKHQAVMDLADQSSSALRMVDARHHGHKQAATELVNDMLIRVESALLGLQLSEHQETTITCALRETAERLLGLYEQGLEVETHLVRIQGGISAQMTPGAS